MLPKLVRDKIPDLIKKSGEKPIIRVASKAEYNNMILQKLSEELLEFHENPSVEEAADIYEVFISILNNWDISFSSVRDFAIEKAESRGGFSQGIILERVENE